MDILKDFEQKNLEIIKHFKDELAQIRGSRPSAKLVENIEVDYLGQKLKVVQLGTINVLPPREIQITAWDKESAEHIAKAVEASLKVNTEVQGTSVRVMLPQLSEERRQEFIKLVKSMSEENKIKLRAWRDEILKKIKEQEKKGEIREDEMFRLKKEIDKNIEKTSKDLDKLLENKIKEIEE